MWSKAEAALETINYQRYKGKKASEPGHPTLQSAAAQPDNGNHDTITKTSDIGKVSNGPATPKIHRNTTLWCLLFSNRLVEL